MDFNEEDNNPFSGTSHLFASGISRLNEDFSGNGSTTSYYNKFDNGFMSSKPFSEEGNYETFSASVVHGGTLESDILESPTEEQFAPLSTDNLKEDYNEASHVEGADDDIYSNVPVYLQNSVHTVHENTIMGITITDAGHVRDIKGNKVIAYTILFEGAEIKRRYSEFDSLRSNLIRLFPTLIIPSIPEKHSIVKYFINPLNAKNDLKVIEKRKRLLLRFLQRCLNNPQISESFIFKRFLSPQVNWADVLKNPPISTLPASNLLAPPLNPTKPSPLHLLLPIPQSSSINNYRPREEDKKWEKEFQECEQIFKTYRNYTTNMVKNIKKQKRHFKGYINDLGELGAYYNAFSLEDRIDELASSIEKTGQAIDINYLNSEAFNFKVLTVLEEPITELLSNSNESLNVLYFRKLKVVQLFIIDTTIKRRKTRLESLKNAREQASRLEEILKKNAEQSPTIAAAVKRLENGESLNKLSPWQRFLNNGNAPSEGSSSFNEQDVSNMNDLERNIEMEKLEKELVKLDDCLNVILEDLEQVNNSIKENIDSLLREYNQQWKKILKDYSRSLLIWLKDNLDSWKEAKEEIGKINVKKPVEIQDI